MSSGIFSEGTFLYLLVLVAGIAHIGVIVLVIYHSCCKGKCSKEAQNNALPSSAALDNADSSESLASNTSNDFASLEEINMDRTTVRQVTTWQSSLLARVRARLRIHGGSRSTNSDNGNPLSYPGQSTYPAFNNQGVSFEENAEPSLPSYQDCARQQENMNFNTNTGQYEIEKPPSYQEVMEQKNQESKF